jgi:regulator of sigma E protease
MNFFDILHSTQHFWIYAGSFILVLSILVFIHELGHYLMARWCGVKVEVFSIGFGKELFGFNDRKGTRWKVSLVPLGGYVKLFGDTDPASVKHKEITEDETTGAVRPLSAEERNVAFFAKPVGKRAAIVIAGPGINYIFAIVVFAIMFTFTGRPVTPPTAAAVIVGSSAEKAGFHPHDLVVSINGKKIGDFEEIRREMMIGLDTKKHFVIERNGKKMDLYAQPQKIEVKDRFGFKHSSGLLGLISPRHAVEIKNIAKVDGVLYANEDDTRKALQRHMGKTFTIEMKKGEEKDLLVVGPKADFNKGLMDASNPDHDLLFVNDGAGNVMVHYGFFGALKQSLNETWSVTQGTLEALGQIIMGTRSATELGGVIRIGALAGDMAQQGFIAFALFTALLSINLGLVNLFPIPMLDGGHLLFYAFEAALGRPIPERIQEYAFRFGLVFLVGLMVYANLNDIVQLIL